MTVKAGHDALNFIASDDREDLKQEYELERAKAAAEGHAPRPRRWVVADYWRKRLGREGQRRAMWFSPISSDGYNLADAPHPHEVEKRRSAYETAMKVALGLPPRERAVLVEALTVLGPPSVRERVRAWLSIHPGERATHREIADAIGVRRESVTRAISRMRREKEKV